MAQASKCRDVKPWTAVKMWADHRKRLEAELNQVYPECQTSPFPIGKVVSGLAAQVSLPWNDRKRYLFDAPHAGNASHVLFLKFLMYAIKRGADRLVWIAPEHAKTPLMSFFGIVGVVIPAADRKQYSALCGVFPLKCEFDGEDSQKKTLDKNLKTAGMIETVNSVTNEVILSYSSSIYEQMKAQLQRMDDVRREKRRVGSSMAIESLLAAAAADPLVPDVVVSFQAESVVSNVVEPVASAAIDITASLPGLSEALGWSVESLTELSQACKRAREAKDGQTQATKRVEDAKAELSHATKRVADAEEALQKAAEEHDQANECLRSVRARLCAE